MCHEISDWLLLQFDNNVSHSVNVFLKEYDFRKQVRNSSIFKRTTADVTNDLVSFSAWTQ